MEISNITKQAMSKMFSEGKRFDGRGLLDHRDLELEYDVSNQAEGSVRVRLGKTEVVVGVKIGLGTPYPDSPDKGNLMCTAELLPIASPRYESGPPGFKAIELGRLIDRSIRESGMIDFTKLCIEEGEKVWTVFVDMYPINDDGNLIDAANIGAVAALKKAKLPEIDKDGNINYKVRKEPLPLSEEIAPISFSFFKLGDSIILDPTREEEEVSEARVTFGISNYKKQHMVNSCQKIGPVTFTQEELGKILDVLPNKFDELSKKLKL
jgi:exosome complex component RRP42